MDRAARHAAWRAPTPRTPVPTTPEWTLADLAAHVGPRVPLDDHDRRDPRHRAGAPRRHRGRAGAGRPGRAAGLAAGGRGRAGGRGPVGGAGDGRLVVGGRPAAGGVVAAADDRTSWWCTSRTRRWRCGEPVAIDADLGGGGDRRVAGDPAVLARERDPDRSRPAGRCTCTRSDGGEWLLRGTPEGAGLGTRPRQGGRGGPRRRRLALPAAQPSPARRRPPRSRSTATARSSTPGWPGPSSDPPGSLSRCAGRT